ncbi:hypothetical protein ETD86_18025 [Nonomuraea turkmeniaca]|uniref:Septum formation initiator family protein n=1 Tax=Nonomuraea turkmeniaca TaxID=103838 RepID=A0A5S4FJ65_9ACTN|nr:hypothetical protein [Nonomuraea turkmeniaca]TMR20673.1 hypothetical protein ETD86_18025 [Nonomuraea turkmeniaca]
MTTEQETGRGAPVRRAVPKTGTRRYGAPHQSKPRPRPDTRPENGGKAPVDERARPDAGAKRPVAEARPAPRRRPARRQRTPFVLLVVGLMSGGLVSLLLLNTMLAQDAITDATLREEIQVARQENEKIEQEYRLKTQPDAIAKLAEQQGQKPDWDDVNGWSSAGDRVGQVDTER